MCPVPHRGGRGQAQAGAQPQRCHWEADRPGGWLHLHPGQHRQGHHVERRDPGHLPDQPQEVHPWHQDGLRGAEEEEGQTRPDCVFERIVFLTVDLDVNLIAVLCIIDYIF